jgi:hypothetical protein
MKEMTGADLDQGLLRPASIRIRLIRVTGGLMPLWFRL